MIFAVWKPVGLTSHDVVDHVRRVTGETRVGHGGTLDPLAEGVLVVGVGREATRQLGQFQRGQDKGYRAVVQLGAFSDTDDSEGPIHAQEGVTPPSLKALKESLKQFEGHIRQKPPKFSAVKQGGVTLYRRSRRGEDVTVEFREVFVGRIHLVRYEWPELELDIECGSGVYIRSIARNLGEVSGVGGYLKSLERFKVGNFQKEHAVRLDHLPLWWRTHSREGVHGGAGSGGN